MIKLLPIVEGQGEIEAVPKLIHRIAKHHHINNLCVLPAQRRGEWPRVRRDFDRYFKAATLEDAPILWVMDFDCVDCLDPEADRNWLLDEARRIDPRQKVDVAFMVKEYESLFIHDPECLKSHFGVAFPEADFPADPESIRDAKGWISKRLPSGRAYKPTTDQTKLTAKVDIERLRQSSASFHRFESAVLKLASSS